MRSVAGTLNHSVPSVQTPAISVAPMPVAKAPNAPCVVVWESVPTSTMPGRTCPFSGSTWWQMPPRPTS